MQTEFRVKIDGKETTLTLRGALRWGVCPTYHTPGNASAHTFSAHLAPGQKFKTNGHEYEVLLESEKAEVEL